MHACLNYNFQIPISLIIFEHLGGAFSHNNPTVCYWDNLGSEKWSHLVKVLEMEPGL